MRLSIREWIHVAVLEGHTSRSGDGSMEYHFELTDNVPPTPHDSPLLGGNTPGSAEGRLELIKELMETCTSLTKRVLALEEAKTAQDRRRLFKGRVETSTDTSLGEDASKQGRISDKTKPMFKDSDFDVLDAEQITTTRPLHVSTTDQVSTARLEVNSDNDEGRKAKEKGVAFKDVKDSARPIRSITTLQPLLKIDPKDKGKSVLVEEEPNKSWTELKKKDKDKKKLLMLLQRKYRARIDVDALFAAKLQQEEREYEVKYEPLSRRFPIMNWEYKLLGNVDAKDMYVYKLTIADGSSSYHGDMQAFLKRLNRQDLNDLY
ncbi:hypothetical protein Tco_1521676, partial [Tanacetum coccineum]